MKAILPDNGSDDSCVCEPEVLAVKTCDCLTYVRLNLEVLARNRGIMLLTALLARILHPGISIRSNGSRLSIW